MSRIKLQTQINTNDPSLDRIQSNLHDAVNRVISSPTLDSQVLTAALANTSAAQVVTFKHNLGRPVKGVHIAGSNALIAASGQTVATSPTTGQITIQVSNPANGQTVTLMVY